MGEVETNFQQLAHKWIGGVMAKLGIGQYETELMYSSGKGEGYIGDVTFVKVTGVDKAGDKKVYEFVVKSGKDNDDLRKQAPIDDAYLNEKYMYNTVFPAVQKFQEEYRIKQPFKQFPRFFGDYNYDGLEILVLESLKNKGYSVYDKNTPLNLDHLKTIFTAYGKWHGVSLAMRRLRPQLFADLTSKLINVFRGFMDAGGIVEPMVQVVQDVFPLFEKEPELLRKYKKLTEQAKEVWLNLTDKNDPCNVISHGDCWNNNFLFAYNGADTTKPKDVCIVDWQLCNPCSPVYDLSYNLYVCASKKELEHFDELLHTYHKSVSDILTEFGCDPEEIFPYKTLMEQWKKYSKFGFLHSIYILTFVVCTKDEAPDLTTASKDEGFKNLMHIKLKDNPLYNQRVSDIVHHYVENFVD